MNDKTSYPLCWPDGWARTKFRSGSRFFSKTQGGKKPKSMIEARIFLCQELERLDAVRTILSTNVELRLDGLPYANRDAPADPGAAVYFQFRNRPVTLACDKWSRVEDNVWAIACHIEALRGQERWGVGTIEQAFRGYMAIPERSEASSWWKILNVAVNATLDQAEVAYRAAAKQHHPDFGVSDQMMAQINLAIEEARKAFGK